MKAVVTILFSLLLVLNPPAFAAAMTVCQSAAGCACSGCDTAKCCLSKDAPASPPLPAAPVSAASQDTLQLLAAAVTHWVMLPAPTVPQSPAFALSPPRPAAVPLYERNCSYLL